MAKSKKTSKTPKSTLPVPPWIYINNAAGLGDVEYHLAQLIPYAKAGAATVLPSAEQAFSHNVVPILHTAFTSPSLAVVESDSLREVAIKRGANFCSINLMDGNDSSRPVASWGTIHLDLDANKTTAEEAAEKIFKWLFTVFTVQEQLHLIPEADMLATDDLLFPDYAYTSIAESRKHPKDGRIQFVALIVNKPTVTKDQRLTWRVVDRTGEANFYFQWRGPDSKETWDWVQKLQPGDRKALPRMPMIYVKEKKRITVAKAPFRLLGATVRGTGYAISDIGSVLAWVGDKVSLGSSGKYVAEEDYCSQKETVRPATAGKATFKIFNEKGEKAWKDDDQSSTTAASIFDEKTEKHFC